MRILGALVNTAVPRLKEIDCAFQVQCSMLRRSPSRPVRIMSRVLHAGILTGRIDSLL